MRATSDLQKARVEAFKREWHKADEEGDSGNRVSRGLKAADAVITVEQIAEPPSRDDIIDALVMTDLSDYAGTDMGMIEQAADAVLALLRGHR